MRAQAIAIAVAVIILAIALVAMNRTLDRRRRASGQEKHGRLAALAADRGWSYQQFGAGRVLPFTSEEITGTTTGHANAVVEGVEQSWPFLACEYSYTVGSVDNQKFYCDLVLVMQFGVQVPRLAIRRRGTGLPSDLLGSPIATGDARFDATFTLDSNSLEFTADVLTPRVRELLLQRPQVALTFTGTGLLLAHRGTDLGAELEGMLRSAVAILNEIPTPVWERLHGDG